MLRKNREAVPESSPLYLGERTAMLAEIATRSKPQAERLPQVAYAMERACN
jgi:hypothetical protein